MPAGSAMKVVAAGECCLDRYEGEPEPRLGGITFNFALHAARAFADVFADAEIHLLSAVGEDAQAAFTTRLEAAGIQHDLVTAGRTPSLDIRLDENGDRTFHNYDPGGLLEWEVTQSQRETITSADLVVLTRYHDIVPLFDRLVQVPTRGQRVVDFADASGAAPGDVDVMLAHRGRADVCIFGIAPTEQALRQHLHTIAGAHHGLFVITRAEQGAEAISGGESFSQPAVPVAEVVDTTGAGDCFAAHFLSSWTATGNLDVALSSGCLAASRVIQQRGAS